MCERSERWRRDLNLTDRQPQARTDISYKGTYRPNGTQSHRSTPEIQASRHHREAHGAASLHEDPSKKTLILRRSLVPDPFATSSRNAQIFFLQSLNSIQRTNFTAELPVPQSGWHIMRAGAFRLTTKELTHYWNTNPSVFEGRRMHFNLFHAFFTSSASSSTYNINFLTLGASCCDPWRTFNRALTHILLARYCKLC